MITRTYCIIWKDFITQDMISEAITDQDKIRYSLDGEMAVLEFDLKFPLSMSSFPKYTHKQILVEMAKAEWSNDG